MGVEQGILSGRGIVIAAACGGGALFLARVVLIVVREIRSCIAWVDYVNGRDEGSGGCADPDVVYAWVVAVIGSVVDVIVMIGRDRACGR